MKFLGNVLATIIGIFVLCCFSWYCSDWSHFGGESEGVVVEKNSVIELI
jgi:protease-4